MGTGYNAAPDWSGDSDGRTGTSTWPVRRMFRWALDPRTVVQAAPSAGGDVDAIAGAGGNALFGGEASGSTREFYLAVPGRPVVVEAGAAFTEGANLETDSQGRAVAATTGTVVARALEAASQAGDYVLAVFVSR